MSSTTSTSGDLELLLGASSARRPASRRQCPPRRARRHASDRPGAEEQQPKSWPIEAFFHKIVMVRNRLRTLESK